MRVSQAEMAQSHQRIVESAALLVREKGVDGPSLGDLMKGAGLTHGGFYRHFENREALVEAAVAAAFEQYIAGLRSNSDRYGPDIAAAMFRTDYLSNEHIQTPASGCPVATLGVDIGRGSEALKARFDEGLNQTLEALAPGMAGDTAEEKRRAALRQLAMLAGAAVIARASSAQTAADVLQACAAPQSPPQA